MLKPICQVLPKRSEIFEKNRNSRLAHLPAINGERYKRIFSLTDGVKSSNSKPRKAFVFLWSVLCKTRVKESIALMSIKVLWHSGVVCCLHVPLQKKKSFFICARKLFSHLVTNFLITMLSKRSQFS